MFAYYADINANGIVVKGLRRRGIDVKLAWDDGFRTTADPEILRRATQLGRLLFTHDNDFHRIAAEFQTNAEHFAGVVFTHQHIWNSAECIEQMELIADACLNEDVNDTVKFLPLATSS